jgi:hypothetical protein
MAIPIRYATAGQEIPLGYFLDSTDGDSEETTLTIANTDIKLWKMGATTLADKAVGGATHISNGIYYTVLDATDSNTLGSLIAFVHAAGALAIRVECEVMPANRYDALVAGTDVLQVDLTQIGGVTQSATDLKDFADAGYDPVAHKTQGVVLCDTATTMTDKAGFSLSTAGVDAILDSIIEGTYTLRQYMRVIASMLWGKVSGGGTTTISFRDTDDSKDRIVMTVTDVGNRTNVNLDET